MAIRKTSGFLMTALLGVIFCSVSAMASTVLFSTLGPHDEYSLDAAAVVGGLGNLNYVDASPFTVAAGATVGDAVLALGKDFAGNNPLTVYIESDSDGAPGSIITTFSQVGEIPSWFNGQNGGLVTFTCDAACTLVPGSYWLVAQQPDAGTTQVWDWAYQNESGPTVLNDAGSASGPWSPGTGVQLAFRLDAAPSIPEPNSLVLLGSGLCGVAALVRRRPKS